MRKAERSVNSYCRIIGVQKQRQVKAIFIAKIEVIETLKNLVKTLACKVVNNLEM